MHFKMLIAFKLKQIHYSDKISQFDTNNFDFYCVCVCTNLLQLIVEGHGLQESFAICGFPFREIYYLHPGISSFLSYLKFYRVIYKGHQKLIFATESNILLISEILTVSADYP